MFTEFPRPDPSQFTTRIDNPFLTYRPGTTFVHENREAGEEVRVTVTGATRIVDGVTCVVVHDVAREDGFVIEDTYDYYAQDAAGNVWYFGERTAEYEPGNPDPVSTEGSWEAGVDGAEAGVVMLAEPEVGIRYRQEYYAGEAEDWAEIRSLDARVDVTYGRFEGALKTRDVNPLEPSTERKFYVAGVGEALAVDAERAREELVRIEVEGGPGRDRLLGYAGGDHMRGHGGGDVIRGLGGDDRMAGGAGCDRLLGGTGDDRLRGGAGDDRLHGGAGGDVFVFGRLTDGRAETDTVCDYDAGAGDALRIAGGAGAVAAEARAAQGWTLTLEGDGDRIRLVGIEDRDHDGHVTDELLFA